VAAPPRIYHGAGRRRIYVARDAGTLVLLPKGGAPPRRGDAGFFYVDGLFGILQHGIFGPMGFAIRFCGGSSDAVVQILKLEQMLVTAVTPIWYVGAAIWIFLTLWKKAGVPRWTILLCPLLITGRLDFALLYVPSPLGLPLYDGWGNIVDMIWFVVLALTYKDQEIKSGIA
jgi:hypothetical protein